jgi:hypothetical protein
MTAAAAAAAGLGDGDGEGMMGMTSKGLPELSKLAGA